MQSCNLVRPNVPEKSSNTSVNDVELNSFEPKLLRNYTSALSAETEIDDAKISPGKLATNPFISKQQISLGSLGMSN